MTLFDPFAVRVPDLPPQRRSEFAFLNATGIPQAAAIRTLLDEAFANFTGDKLDLRNRFRSADNAAHVAAAFELVLHEIMVRQGLQPTSPVIAGGKRPDLRVDANGSSAIVIEARMTQPNENVHYRQALDAIAAVRRPFIEWHVWIDEDPRSQVSAAVLTAQLTTFANAHPAGALPEVFSRDGPHLLFEQDDTRLRIYGIRKPDQPDGEISWHEADGEFADTDDIRKAIKRKKGRYELTEPYVLALCSAKGWSRQDQFREALFRESRGACPEDLRGFWAKGQASRVSGVLACYSFKPASIHGARMQLFINPNATHPLVSNPFGCVTASPTSPREAELTTPLSDLLKLPPGWPGE